MSDKDSYVLCGDDGRTYRVTSDQLEAFRVSPDDPAVKNAAHHCHALRDAAEKAGVLFACLIAAKHQAPDNR